MKKIYFAPVATATSIEAESMIAASPVTLNLNSNNSVKANQALDGGRRGEWGNLWNE